MYGFKLNALQVFKYIQFKCIIQKDMHTDKCLFTYVKTINMFRTFTMSGYCTEGQMHGNVPVLKYIGLTGRKMHVLEMELWITMTLDILTVLTVIF